MTELRNPGSMMSKVIVILFICIAIGCDGFYNHFYGVHEPVKEIGIVIPVKPSIHKSLIDFLRTNFAKVGSSVLVLDSIGTVPLNDDSAIIVTFKTPPLESYHIKVIGGNIRLVGIENYAIHYGSWIYSSSQLDETARKRILNRIDSAILRPYELSNGR